MEIMERMGYTYLKVRIGEFFTVELFVCNEDVDRVAELLESDGHEVNKIRNPDDLVDYLYGQGVKMLFDPTYVQRFF